MPVVGTPVLRRSDLVDGASLAVFTTLPARGEKAPEFEAATLPVLPEVQTKEDPGTLFYAVGKHRKVEGTHYLVELYKDQAALESHAKQAYVAEMNTAQEACLEKPALVKRFVPVGKSYARPELISAGGESKL